MFITTQTLGHSWQKRNAEQEWSEVDWQVPLVRYKLFSRWDSLPLTIGKAIRAGEAVKGMLAFDGYLLIY